MKEVLAMIRINRINKTKRALSDAGISSFTATGNVMGRGQGEIDYKILHGAEEGIPEAIAQLGDGPKLVPKRFLFIVIPDEKVDLVVETIIQANKTGSSGDGKIFVLPILEAHRVRTGECGNVVLD